MFYKRIFVNSLSIFIILFLFCPALAQIRKVQKFKKVEIPFNLKHKDLIIKKGKYDFEIIAHRTLGIWNLRIQKKGKNICIVSGEVLRDKAPGARGDEMSDVPDDPTLKFRRIPAKKIVHIIFEMGKTSYLYPCYKVRFQMEYE